MSICRADGSSVLWPHLYQRPDSGLRYTAFVELMGVAMRYDFFQAGAPSPALQSGMC